MAKEKTMEKKSDNQDVTSSATIEIVEMWEAKKFAKTIGQETAQNILAFIAEKKGSTATEIAKGLQTPLSTVHYNLKSLVKAKIIDDNSFHYSSKGKEVAHYELTGKVIVIVPKKSPGLLTQLTTVLPGLFIAGIIGAIGLGAALLKSGSASKISNLAVSGAREMSTDMVTLTKQAPATQTVVETSSQNTHIFAGILIGIGTVILGMIIFWFIRKTIRK